MIVSAVRIRNYSIELEGLQTVILVKEKHNYVASRNTVFSTVEPRTENF